MNRSGKLNLNLTPPQSIFTYWMTVVYVLAEQNEEEEEK